MASQARDESDTSEKNHGESELTLKRSRIASLSEERSPYLGYCGRYNKNWEIDIVSLPHNSLRKQLNHLFISTNSLGKMAMDVSHDDLKKFYSWFDEMRQFLDVVLHAEEYALYPYIYKLANLDEEKIDVRLRKSCRTNTKMDVLNKASNLANTMASGKSSSDIIEALREAADEMSIVLLKYFSNKEEVLPKLIKVHGGKSRDKRVVEFSTVQHIMKRPNGFRNIEFLLSSLEKTAIRQEFIKNNIPNIFRRKKIMKF
eukprot:Plantae.Rhodophyta-Hildenbrandia_rubra.ctg32924.p1 GENE.Plantae.Rhodophyta-Hildenbrandia_rubra.ctg32924~~Plantae.Rhodophyta-Hildenbrandia_rubra.ctg32924.p1  ORF type:complete len:258 (-),score=36.66 Plantae.Rhodophyta-Hildenbrandia_rubra.ctg32924:1038-1811(-)